MLSEMLLGNIPSPEGNNVRQLFKVISSSAVMVSKIDLATEVTEEGGHQHASREVMSSVFLSHYEP